VLQDRLDRHTRDSGLLIARLEAGEDQKRVEQALEASGVALDVLEKAVSLLPVVLGAGLKDLDRARDRGDGRAQLMGRVLDEVPRARPAARLF